ncbi:MAG: molybdenum ABC transporter ATP-binding protein [Nitrospinaceae bacterium]
MNGLQARFDVTYPDFHLRTELTVPGRGVTVVFGPSGCGKTTFLRCLSGLERPPAGFLRLGREIWQDESRGIFVPPHKRSVGLVFQEARLFPHLSVRSNLNYGFKRTPAGERRISWDQVIGILDLGSLLDRRPHHLSVGEGQRVALGRALLTSPKLLLMDEPLAGLDIQRKREILPYIRRLQKELELPMVYVSHSLGEVLQLVDTMVIMNAGRILATGPVEEVFSHLGLQGKVEPALIGAVLDTTVEKHDPEFGLTTLTFKNHRLHVPRQDAAIGQSLRIHIHSRDVSIVLSPPHNETSVLNILEARVAAIAPVDPRGYSVDIQLDVGQPLIATITRKSLAKLGLAPGQKVYAQIKAIKMVHEWDELSAD